MIISTAFGQSNGSMLSLTEMAAGPVWSNKITHIDFLNGTKIHEKDKITWKVTDNHGG